MSGEARATEPEDVTRLVAERLNADDAAGVAALYEPEAALATQPTTGRAAIRANYQQMAGARVTFASRIRCPP
jgi:ketosteroid isomerase-like protein